MALFNLYQGGTGGGSGDEIFGFIGTPAKYIESSWLASIISVNSMTAISTIPTIVIQRLKQNVHYINGPQVSWIGTSAFYSAHNIDALICPNCVSIYSNALYNGYIQSLVVGPNCKIQDTFPTFASSYPLRRLEGGILFCNTNNWNEYSNRIVLNYVSVAANAYVSFSVLNTQLTALASTVTGTTSADITINCPNLTSINYIISGSTTVAQPNFNIYMPKIKYIGSLRGSSTLQAGNIVKLYLNSVSAVPTLNTSTRLGASQTYIYVPKSLYNSFITATNWANQSAYIYSV